MSNNAINEKLCTFARMIYSIVSILPAIVCALFTAILILDWLNGKRHCSRDRLIVFMVVATLLYVCHGIFFNDIKSFFPLTDTIYCMCNLAVFPLYHIYFISLVSSRAPEYGWLFPSMISGGLIGGVYIFMSPAEISLFADNYLYESIPMAPMPALCRLQVTLHTAARIWFAIQLVMILISEFKEVKIFNTLVANCYADTEHRNLESYRSLFILVVIVSAFAFLVNLIGRPYFYSSAWLLAIPSVLFSVLLFSIGYVGLNRSFSIVELEEDMKSMQLHEMNNSNDNLDLLPPEKASQLFANVEKTIEEHQLFLMQNLKVSDLASYTGSNEKYIYYSIKQCAGCTFSELINRKRIEHAIQLMASDDKMKFKQIAIQSGYSSLSSFYRNFKLYRGTTPSEYQDNLLQNRNHLDSHTPQTQ